MLNFAERGYRTETWVAILRFLLFLCMCRLGTCVCAIGLVQGGGFEYEGTWHGLSTLSASASAMWIDSGGDVPEEVGVRGAGRGSEVPWWGGVYIWARYVGLHPEDETRKRWVFTYWGRKGS